MVKTTVTMYALGKALEPLTDSYQTMDEALQDAANNLKEMINAKYITYISKVTINIEIVAEIIHMS